MIGPWLAALLLLVSIWTEPWANLDAWQPITQDCFTVANGRAEAVCQSAALRTLQTWDAHSPLSVTENVCAQPAPGSSTTDYWAGLTIEQDDSHYAELATERHVPPFSQPQPLLVSLRPWGTVEGRGQVGQCYDLALFWQPSKHAWTARINGATVGTYQGAFTSPLAVEILCVSVGENTPDNGSAAACSFGPVTVQGAGETRATGRLR